jgi:PKD repeat protein
MHKITIGSIHEAGFNSSPPVICANFPVVFTDASKVQFGTVSQWNWNFNDGAEVLQTSDSAITKTFPEGNLKIDLTVQTQEGCVSPSVTKNLEITLKPATSISVQDACYGDPFH